MEVVAERLLEWESISSENHVTRDVATCVKNIVPIDCLFGIKVRKALPPAQPPPTWDSPDHFKLVEVRFCCIESYF
jgi:hypothetical protein